MDLLPQCGVDDGRMRAGVPTTLAGQLSEVDAVAQQLGQVLFLSDAPSEEANPPKGQDGTAARRFSSEKSR